MLSIPYINVKSVAGGTQSLGNCLLHVAVGSFSTCCVPVHVLSLTRSVIITCRIKYINIIKTLISSFQLFLLFISIKAGVISYFMNNFFQKKNSTMGYEVLLQSYPPNNFSQPYSLFSNYLQLQKNDKNAIHMISVI